MERLEDLEPAPRTPAADSHRVPFSRVSSNGSEIFSWPLKAFVPSYLVIDLSKRTGVHGTGWSSTDPTPGDDVMLFVIAPEALWKEDTFRCGAKPDQWRVGVQDLGASGVYEAYPAGSWVVAAIATQDGVARVSLGRSATKPPGDDTPPPTTEVQPTYAAGPADIVDATATTRSPTGTDFRVALPVSAASAAWTIVKGSYLREPESRITDAGGTLCADQVGTTPESGFLALGTTLQAGQSYDWSGVQAQMPTDPEGALGAYAVLVPLMAHPSDPS